MTLNVVKPANQMGPKDHSMHANGIDLSRARPQDRVEIMEESQKVVSLDYLKCPRCLEKLTVGLERVKATNDKLMKEGKARES